MWKALHPRLPAKPDGEHVVIEHGDVRIEIVHPGDENGVGLVRYCWFRVPKYLLSGGVARSWEVVTDSVPVDIRRQPDNMTVLSVSGLLAEAIMNVFADDSVSAIFGGENQLF